MEAVITCMDNLDLNFSAAKNLSNATSEYHLL